MPSTPPPPIAPLVYTLADLCAALRCSRAHANRLLATGRVKARKDRGRVVILAEDVRAYLDSLPVTAYTPPPAPLHAERDPAPGPTEDTP